MWGRLLRSKFQGGLPRHRKLCTAQVKLEGGRRKQGPPTPKRAALAAALSFSSYTHFNTVCRGAGAKGYTPGKLVAEQVQGVELNVQAQQQEPPQADCEHTPPPFVGHHSPLHHRPLSTALKLEGEASAQSMGDSLEAGGSSVEGLRRVGCFLGCGRSGTASFPRAVRTEGSVLAKVLSAELTRLLIRRTHLFLPTSPSRRDSMSHSDAHNISSLAISPSRVVIPLGPLPSTAAPAPDSSSSMLLDYLSRLARFEPRIRRYAASKLSEKHEPVHAFSGTSGTTTPLPQTPGSRHSPAGGASPNGGTHSAHGFSLVDLERTLLSAAPKWWTKRAGTGGSTSSTPSHQHDSVGLDVDISSVFLRNTSALSTANGGHDAPLLQKDPGPGLFLNYYSSADLIALLTSTGVLSALAARGYSHPSLIFDTSDSFQHRLSLVDATLFDPKLNLLSSERFLVDLYMKRRRRWGTDAMVCYQLMQRVINAGGWEELRDVTGEIRAPYVGLEGARESIEFFDKMVPKCSKTAKKGGGEWDVTEIAWMQVRSVLCAHRGGS